MLKGEVYFMEKNDWQLEIKYRERKSVRFIQGCYGGLF
jgi:hypothetical protein